MHVVPLKHAMERPDGTDCPGLTQVIAATLTDVAVPAWGQGLYGHTVTWKNDMRFVDNHLRLNETALI